MTQLFCRNKVRDNFAKHLTNHMTTKIVSKCSLLLYNRPTGKILGTFLLNGMFSNIKTDCVLVPT